VTFTILPGLTISTPCPLPNAVINQAYNVTLEATGGAPPYSWFLEGTLPTGLSMTTAGVISGTPSALGQSQFVLAVRDAQERIVRRSCTLNVVSSQQTGPAIFSLFPSTVLEGSPAVNLVVNGQGFRQGARVIWQPGSGETALETTLVNPVRLTAVIPAALVRTRGEFPLLVRQPQSLTAPPIETERVIFTVAEALQITTTCPLREASLNQPFNDRFIAVGGFTPYTWDLAGGELPPGVALNSNGSIGGTPTAPGAFSFTVRVTDQQSNVVTRACSQIVLGPLSAFPSVLSFIASGTGTNPDPQPVGITAVGDSVAFTANANVNWIRVLPTSNRTPATVFVDVNRAGLTTGVHRGIVTFTSDRASNRTATVEVTLRVDAPAPARLEVQPSALRFTLPRGAAGLTRQLLRVTNLGSGSINFTS
jgi:hypothetical protein